jgi:Flp pilus assembly protein TadG
VVNRIRDSEGAAAIEFALVLPVLLLILFAILDYGWYFTQQILLLNAVQQGARASAGIQRADGEDLGGYVDRIRQTAKDTVDNLYGFGSLTGLSVEVDMADGVPETVTVGVSGQPFSPLTGYLPDALVPDRLGARAQMVLP